MIAKAKLLQKIEERLDELVQIAERCVTATNAASTDLEESQLRDLQNPASATDSVAVLENFIGYQMARRKLPVAVGQRILDDIRELGRKAEEIVQDSREALRGARMELIRLYLRFLVRKFVAERKR
jgi:hypothetical protein